MSLDHKDCNNIWLKQIQSKMLFVLHLAEKLKEVLEIE